MKNFTRPMWKAESPGSSHLICGFYSPLKGAGFFLVGVEGGTGDGSLSHPSWDTCGFWQELY